MRNYQVCSRCIMDTSAQEITFDNTGVCSFCTGYDKALKLYPQTLNDKEKSLAREVKEIKKDGRYKKYDCIIGLSGGVDSSYLAYLVKDLGLRALAVHVDTGWNSEIAVGNIENITKILNIELQTIVVDWEEMKYLQRSFLLARLPNCDIPQDHVFMAALMRTARKEKINHIISGHNYVTEYVLPVSWGFPSEDLVHIRDVHKRTSNLRLSLLPVWSHVQKSIADYLFVIKKHRFLNYISYNKSDAKRTIEDKLKWRDYGGKHFESLFTRFFQSYYLPMTFGYDKRRAHLSNLVISGQITRDQALAEMEKPPYDERTIQNDIDYIKRKLEFTDEEFELVMHGPRQRHQDYKTQKSSMWSIFKCDVLLRKFYGTRMRLKRLITDKGLL